MTATAWAVAGVLGAAVALLAVDAVRARRRAARTAARVDALEARLAAVDAATTRALDTARDAAARARGAAGDGEAGPRVVLEPVTGPLVKAVALGAGVRHTVRRLTRSARRKAS